MTNASENGIIGLGILRRGGMAALLAGLVLLLGCGQQGEGQKEKGQESASTEQAAPLTAPSIVRQPTALPPPIQRRSSEVVKVTLESVELEGQLADGTTYPYWTFGGQVPGPFLRVRVDDTVELTLKNRKESQVEHSIDLHAVTGPGGGSAVLKVPPGQEKTLTFKAIKPGLFVYHCATASVAEHISSGMYGLILVEPHAGLPAVDREFYVMQGELYTEGPFGAFGRQRTSKPKLLAETPEYFVFNGAADALTRQHPLQARVGETARLYFGVGGPNFISSFHLIGEHWDRVYHLASLTAPPLTDVQTTVVPPGGATVVEFKLEVPGRFLLVDHALSRLERGLVGVLQVEGPEHPELYQEGAAK